MSDRTAARVWRDPATCLAIGKRSRTPVAHELADELRLNIFGLLIQRFAPSHQQLGAVVELPDVSPAPMSHWLAGSETPELVEPRGKPPPPGDATSRLADVQQRRSAVCPSGLVVRAVLGIYEKLEGATSAYDGPWPTPPRMPRQTDEDSRAVLKGGPATNAVSGHLPRLAVALGGGTPSASRQPCHLRGNCLTSSAGPSTRGPLSLVRRRGRRGRPS